MSLTPAAASAREAARTDTGRFGTQARTSPGDAAPAARPDYTGYTDEQDRQAAGALVAAAERLQRDAAFIRARGAARTFLGQHPHLTHIVTTSYWDGNDGPDGYATDLEQLYEGDTPVVASTLNPNAPRTLEPQTTGALVMALHAVRDDDVPGASFEGERQGQMFAEAEQLHRFDLHQLAAADDPEPPPSEHPAGAGTVSMWTGEQDGVPVFQIDTASDGGRLRINVNDAPVWDADPEQGQTIADLDGTDDRADWIADGHVLDVVEVEYLRTLRLPI